MNPRITIAIAALSATTLFSCHHTDAPSSSSDAQLDSLRNGIASIPTVNITIDGRTYNVADIEDEAHIYRNDAKPEQCFIVISKREYRLYVYEADSDTALIAHFPICYAKNPEAKERGGDMRTPESTMASPFRISQIQPADFWCHDFSDGRGPILAYGNWFLRLDTPGFTGIGIHGSTNNEASVPGRDSEGCIRMRDADLCTLHDKFVTIGTPVIIKGINEMKLPFEQRAQQQTGDAYCPPRKGNPLAQTATPADSTAHTN